MQVRSQGGATPPPAGAEAPKASDAMASAAEANRQRCGIRDPPFLVEGMVTRSAGINWARRIDSGISMTTTHHLAQLDIATMEEAAGRPALLRSQGTSAAAFTFARPFDPPGIMDLATERHGT